MKHNSIDQSKRVNKGKDNEKYISKIFKAKKVFVDSYDLESRNYLIEVKSINAIQKIPKGYQNGRYVIKRDNHVMLKLKGDQKLKTSVYVFVLNIGSNRIFKKVSWDKVEDLVDYSRSHTNITWYKIFY